MITHLDQYVARLQNLEPFEIHAVSATGEPHPWYTVTGEIVRDLVIFEPTLSDQVQTIAGQIAHWGRLSAQAKRIWEIEERLFRQWKAKEVLRLSEPPSNKGEAEGWKKPSEAKTEALYRIDPAYAVWNTRVERAEEAYNASVAILEGFKAKKEMLRFTVFKGKDENLHFSIP